MKTIRHRVKSDFLATRIYESHTSVDIYGPFSNVLSHNMSAWSNVSQWATEELKKADNLGLIPSSLKGADMTKPITREEFADKKTKRN